MFETQTKYKYEDFSYKDKQFTPLNQNLRVNFVRKVFGIVSIQLLSTFFMSCLTMTIQDLALFQQSHPSLLILSIFVAVATMLMLSCSSNLRRHDPTNLIILGIFTLAESYSVSTIVSVYPQRTVLMALFLTATVVSSLALYALTTNHEVNFFGGLIVLASSAMLMCLLVVFIIGGGMVSSLISIISAVLAGLYLIYDIQLLMGNDDKRKIDIDDYILGFLMIFYMDVIRIFLEILKLLNEVENNKEKKRKN